MRVITDANDFIQALKVTGICAGKHGHRICLLGNIKEEESCRKRNLKSAIK